MIDKTKINLELSVGNLLYLGLVVAIVIILCFNFLPLEPDPDSARYMLSALVQSEAAIIAIVITLSSVAVQLAANSYSPRVIDLYQKSLYLWLLVLLYLGAMIFGLYVLYKIEEWDNTNIMFAGLFVLNQIKSNDQTSLGICISFSYRLGIIAFLALIPHIWNTLELIKPSTIIKKLSQDITKNSIKSHQDDYRKYRDPIQPIVDIIKSSLYKQDLVTLSDGIQAIENRILYIFEHDPLKDDQEQLDVLNNLFYHFRDLRDLAVQKKYLKARSNLIFSMGQIGSRAIDMDIEVISSESSEYLQDFLKIEVSEKNDDNASDTIFQLDLIASRAAKKAAAQPEYMKIISSTIESMVKNGNRLIKPEFEYTLFFIGRTLGDIIASVPKGLLEKEVEKAIEYVKTALDGLSLMEDEDFKYTSRKHICFEYKKTLGRLYNYVGNNEDAKLILTEVAEFEKKDTSDPYAPSWYGETWFVLSQVYHDLGDNSKSEEASEKASKRGYHAVS